MRFRLLFALLPLVPLALLAAPSPRTAPAGAAAHVMVDAASLDWGPAPPGLPPGVQAAVLSGDPGKPGLFVIRLKAPAGYRIPRHWHPTDEHVTVLEGDFHLDMGGADGAHAHDFAPGGYALLPAKMQHAASTNGGAVVQVSGMGPFVIHYVDPKDDPRTAAKPS
ncbi:MAG: cupin domain-containing protein [Lysobacteraceae bacterium]